MKEAKRTLYTIEGELAPLLNEYSTCEDEVRSLELYEQISALDVERDQKLFGICSAYKNLSAESEMFKAEIDRLKGVKARIDANVERLEGYLSRTIGEGTSWKEGVHSISWRPSKRLEPLVEINAMPEKYVRVKKEFDKEILTKDLKAVPEGESALIKFLCRLVPCWNLKIG